MKKYLLLFILSFSAYGENLECVPPHEFFPFEGSWVTKNDYGSVELGMYARISPDGKYVLRSHSGRGLTQVTLMELVHGEKSNSVKAYQTPLSNEAFPVQGTWRYLEDTNGDHYRLIDILKDQKKAKKQFKGGIGGFYTVAAELPNGKLGEHKMRSLSWPNSEFDNMGVGVLSNMIVTAQIDKDGNAKKIDSSSAYYMCGNLKSTDGRVMSLPMISPDALEFASMPQNPKDHRPSMRIYKFGENNESCEKVLDLNISIAKIIFSFREQNQLLFYSSGSFTTRGNGVHFFDRDIKKIFTLDDGDRKIRADSFPGFTKDGRIVYGAYWEDCDEIGCKEKAGYVISDPNQSPDLMDFKKNYPEDARKFKTCVTLQDVMKSKDEQDKVWSYK